MNIADQECKPAGKMSKEVGDEYSSSLADLTMNSKPLINMLTILAEESLEHAPVIVQSVEKHLDKVRPEIKLPVLYLVDSIIKNVGGAYTQLFSQIIVNMFCKVFKQVDEKTRSQMFKLRETWHDVFPSIKLYQLDVKVNVTDPAWPIQARPPQTNNIHVNPNFLGRTTPLTAEEEGMRAAVARKEQELLQLQRKKIEMELEQTRKQLLEQRKALERTATHQVAHSTVSAVAKPRPAPVPATPRIAPANSALVNTARRRDPRLTRPPAPPPAPPVRDPRLSKKGPAMPVSPLKQNHHRKSSRSRERDSPAQPAESILPRVDKLPPIPRVKGPVEESPSPNKRKKESPRATRKRKKTKEGPSVPVSVPAQPAPPVALASPAPPAPEGRPFRETKGRSKDRNYMRRNRERSPSPAEPAPSILPVVVPNGNSVGDVDLRTLVVPPRVLAVPPRPLVVPSPAACVVKPPSPAPDAILDLPAPAAVALPELPVPPRKRSPPEQSQHEPTKKTKSEKLDALFGAEDVDLRTLPPVGEEEDGEGGGWARVKEGQSPAGAEQLAAVRAKLAEATRARDPLGRPRLFTADETKERRKSRNSEDTDMRPKPAVELDGNTLDGNIKIIMSQAEEQLKTGNINKQQYNILLMQVLELNERQKLKEAKQKESLEASKRRLHMLQAGRTSPLSDSDSLRSPSPPPSELYGDIDERVPPHLGPRPEDKRTTLLPCPDYLDSDMRTHGPLPERYQGRLQLGPRGFRGGWRGRPEWHGPRGFRPRGPSMPWRGSAPQERRPSGLCPPLSNPCPPPGPCPPLEPARMGPCPLIPYIRSVSPPPLGMSSAKDGLPPVASEVVEYINRDTMKTIAIDGVAREIRFYGTTAVVMLEWDDPREISFQTGQRRLFLDDESFLLGLNQDFTSITIDGKLHRIRLGAPTRELFIDDSWLECFFGGPPVPVLLDGKIRMMKLEGPAPQVSVGTQRRSDLVAGKIKLIVNATTMLPVFLDAKPQTFQIEGVSHTLRFVDALRTVLINEKPFKVEFGGLPKPIYVSRWKHFIRFSVLPASIKAGQVVIANMEGSQPEPSPLLPAPSEPEPAPPALELPPPPQQQPGVSVGLDMLTSIVPSGLAPASQFEGYSVAPPDLSVPPPTAPAAPINVGDLFAKLVASGILSSGALPTTEPAPVAPAISTVPDRQPDRALPGRSQGPPVAVKPVSLLQPETLRVRQATLVGALHAGMQCGSCGARFPPEHTVRYSQHLDWHFRQNRADRDSQRRPHSRPWYYDISDWVQFEEIEDLEEREKSWFERQQEESEAGGSERAGEGEGPEGEEVGVAAPPPSAPPHQLRCPHCGDPFDQYYNQELEEWQLRRAVAYQGDNYHPLCLQEYKVSMVVKEAAAKEEPDRPAEEEMTGIEDEPTEAEVQEELAAAVEDEPAPEEEEEDEVQLVEEEEDDDDVVIKAEPVEQIVVDDQDTDEETERERAARDADPVNFTNIKIKQEPMDPDDEPIITAEEDHQPAPADTTHAAVVSSIDGNVQLEPAVLAVPGSFAPRIRINITRPPSAPAPPQPPPPGEEPPEEEHSPTYRRKPALESHPPLERCPPVQRGRDLSALCSIM